MKWYAELINGLKSIQNSIENDTWEYLENDKPIPDIHIEYRGMKVDIPLELAEMNNEIQAELQTLVDLTKDTYVPMDEYDNY